ncbi:MAG: MarR family winged helix-turn-helix transcriptional regulator [Nocardioidaceae bacterium]
MSNRGRAALEEDLRQAMRVQVTAAVLMNQAIAAKVALNPVDLQALNLLSLRGPSSPKDLAEAMAMSRGGAVTAVIDRLEKSGYVRRTRESDDRRQVLVELIRGEQMHRIVELFDPLGEVLADAAAHYSDTQVGLIADFMHRSNAALGFDRH